MADVYASAVGTTVLQLKEIPPRPVEFDGALCLFGLRTGVDEASVRRSFEGIGKVLVKCELATDPALVYFVSHESALQAKMGPLAAICDGCCALYNERSYDGRGCKDGRDADNGRGWCAWSFYTPLVPLPTPADSQLQPTPTRQTHNDNSSC